jgi:hypothetical protein
LKSALQYYDANLYTLAEHLNAIKDGNAQPVKDLMDRFVGWYFKNGVAMEDLDPYSVTDVNGIKSNLGRILLSTIDRLQASVDFRIRAGNILAGSDNAVDVLRAVEWLNNLSGSITSRPFWMQWAGLKEDLLIQFISRWIRGDVTLQSLQELPGNGLARIKALDEAREKIADSDLKSGIALLRQRLLDGYIAGNLLDASNIGREIISLQKAGDQLTEQAKYALTQAQKSFSDDNYGAAFSQISLANALLNSSMAESYLSAQEKQKELVFLKNLYDRLPENVGNVLIERKIVALSELAQSSAGNAYFLSWVRDIKLMMAHAQQPN